MEETVEEEEWGGGGEEIVPLPPPFNPSNMGVTRALCWSPFLLLRVATHKSEG